MKTSKQGDFIVDAYGKLREVVGMCGCGNPIVTHVVNGNRIGIAHLEEDEDHHNKYFSEMRLLLVNTN